MRLISGGFFLPALFGLVTLIGCANTAGSNQRVTPATTSDSTQVGFISETPLIESPSNAPGRGLELNVISLTPSASPGGEVTLRILTAPTASVSVEIHYPETNETVMLERRSVGPEGDASWSWQIPPDILPGEARINISAAVIGRAMETEAFFFVSSP